MHYLFIWYIPLNSKDFYMTVNLLDVISIIFFNSYFMKFISYPSKLSHNVHQNILWLFILMSIVALVVFFTKNTYRHITHKIYMLLRFFVTFVSLIMVFWAITDIIGENNSKRKAESVISWLVYGCFNLLNLFWSLELLKIIN